MVGFKALIFALSFFLCLGLSPGLFAESISDYRLTPVVPINKTQTVTGVYSTETTDLNELELCSFTVVDQDGYAVYRASDQHPQSNGFFSAQFTVKEPYMKMGGDYNVTTRCGGVSDTNSFNVDLPESIDQPILAGAVWILREENYVPLIFLVFAVLCILILWAVIRS